MVLVQDREFATIRSIKVLPLFSIFYSEFAGFDVGEHVDQTTTFIQRRGHVKANGQYRGKLLFSGQDIFGLQG